MQELIALLGERLLAGTSQDSTTEKVATLDARISAMAADLASRPEQNLSVLEEHIRSGDRSRIHAAMYVLLRMSHEKATDLLIETLLAGKDGTTLDAVARALCESKIDGLPLELLLDSVVPDVASVILLALASHSHPIHHPQLVEACMACSSAETRIRAWQTVALLGPEHAV